MDIQVLAHYRTLQEAPDYNGALEALLAEHFGGEPWERLVRLSARHSFAQPGRPAPEPLLQRLCASDLDRRAEDALRRLVALLPPPRGPVRCHVLPSLTAAMGGCSYAPGKMLIALADKDVLESRLLRNVAHEYSHSVRLALWPQDAAHGCGPAQPHSVRAYLVMEGLADALADHLYPWDRPDARLPEALEPAYWDAIAPHLDETGSAAYVSWVVGEMPGLPSGAGYAAGTRLVRSFLRASGTDAVAAQTLPWERVYWASAYAFAR